MTPTCHQASDTFFVAGINYKKSDVNVRGQFTINADQYKAILAKAHLYQVTECFILSTCNRTEIYGVADNAEELTDLLCSETAGSAKEFSRLAYIKKGEAAIEHLFQVGAGLDSQLLGDYEIVGQIRQAVKLSREHRYIQTFLDKLVSMVLQCTKVIRTHTKLSEGTVSVSYAAIQYIRDNVDGVADKNILLIGTGKMGSTTCRNLIDYLGANNITLMNRSWESAATLAHALQVNQAPMSELAAAIQAADIILLATSATRPLLLRSHFAGKADQLIIDLSVPCNVEAGVESIPGLTMLNVDDLTTGKDQTLQKRELEIPKAKTIILQHIAAHKDWYEARKHAPVLQAIKSKLNELNSHPQFLYINKKLTAASGSKNEIQRILNAMACKMRDNYQHGCYFIEAINEYIGAAH